MQFQYCQKLVVFRPGLHEPELLLARRRHEADLDQTYSFIGGKLETADGGIVAGLQREKNEEIGTQARLTVCPFVSYNVYFIKKDGNHMILPHYYAEFIGGDITLNEEYSDYRWIPQSELARFEPKVETIPSCAAWALRLQKILQPKDFVEI